MSVSVSGNGHSYNPLINAINFAAIKHESQRRKNPQSSPYINHPIQVMTLLSDCGVEDITTLQASVLHDTLEDTQTTEDEVREKFGESVLALVKEVSYGKEYSQIDRKKMELASPSHISNKAKLIKQADKYSNISKIDTEPPKWSEERIRGFICWSALVCKGCRGVNAKLDQKVEELLNRLLENHTPSTEDVDKYYQILSRADKGMVTSTKETRENPPTLL